MYDMKDCAITFAVISRLSYQHEFNAVKVFLNMDRELDRINATVNKAATRFNSGRFRLRRHLLSSIFLTSLYNDGRYGILWILAYKVKDGLALSTSLRGAKCRYQYSRNEMRAIRSLSACYGLVFRIDSQPGTHDSLTLLNCAVQ